MFHVRSSFYIGQEAIGVIGQLQCSNVFQGTRGEPWVRQAGQACGSLLAPSEQACLTNGQYSLGIGFWVGMVGPS